MLVILSPAKTQDFLGASPSFKSTPLFFEKTAVLVKLLKALSPQALESLLNVSPKLATLNFERYLHFDLHCFDTQNSRACFFAYQGDVYQGLQAKTLTSQELDFANEHLLILSGLYGALRPLDAIQPYRLEMATKLALPHHKSLADFWQDTLTIYFNERLKYEKFLVNLASNEYSSVLNSKNLQGKLLQVTFKNWHRNQFKIIGLFAKKARGMMARFIIENQLDKPESIKGFQNGYAFQANLSTDDHYIFHEVRS